MSLALLVQVILQCVIISSQTDSVFSRRLLLKQRERILKNIVEVTSILEKCCKVYCILVEHHSSHFSRLLTDPLFNKLIDSVSDHLLSLIWISSICESPQVNCWVAEQRLLLLLWYLNHHRRLRNGGHGPWLLDCLSGVVAKLGIVLESLVIVVGCVPLVTLRSTAASTTATTASIHVLLTTVILLITRWLSVEVVIPLFSRLRLTHGIRDVLLGIEI